jgi:hypothetical protein
MRFQTTNSKRFLLNLPFTAAALASVALFGFAANIRAAMLRTHTLFALLAVAFFALGTSRALSQTNNVFVGYYGTQRVSEFSIAPGTNGTNTTLTGGSVFASGSAAEGISCLMGASGPIPNELFVSDFNTGGVAIYSTGGGPALNTNFLKNSAGMTMSLEEIAGSALSSDGHTLYVADSAGGPGGAGAIYSFSTMPQNFGDQIGMYPFAGAHDVTFYDNYLYASAFSHNNAISAGVWRISPDLAQGCKSSPIRPPPPE